VNSVLKHVTKSDGTIVEFEERKIVETCTRIGVDAVKAKEIAKHVESSLPDKSTTHQIYDFIMEEVEKNNPRSAALLGLREAIADLDSESFERFTKSVLEAHGWKCHWNQVIPGRSVEHQVDVVAQKGDDTWVVECKRHFNPHRWCGLDVMLQVQARLEDLRDGSMEQTNKYKWAGAWIWTNTKFSEHAKAYASAKLLRLTGWRSGEFGLERLVEEKKVWPVTMLKLDLMTKAKLLGSHIVTVNDILAAKKTQMPNWADIVNQAKAIMR